MRVRNQQREDYLLRMIRQVAEALRRLRAMLTRDDAMLAIVRREVGLLTSLVHELQELSLAESRAMRFDIADINAVRVARDGVAAIASVNASYAHPLTIRTCP